jgi:RNA polymerase sigma factor (sigma-70 family)
MSLVDVGKTRPSQLRRVADGHDDVAWTEFHERYDPLLRCCCRQFSLDGWGADEVCQETGIEVANRMETFVYDPGRSFRGWLWRVCERKAIDYLRRHTADVAFPFEERDEELGGASGPVGAGSDEDNHEFLDAAEDQELEPKLLAMMRSARQIQDCVKQSVKPETWEAFWLVGINFWSLKVAADYLNMKIAAVSAAKNRVERKLKEEGHRLEESR